MSIIVPTKTRPDVYVSESDLRRYQDEYGRFCMFYCGTPPSLEDFIRSHQNRESSYD